MELEQVTYVGPPLDDAEILDAVPPSLAGLLRQVNGFVQFHGGFHLRGACLTPSWHSLRNAWIGPDAFHQMYRSMLPTDIPFAEDCLGDQFFSREGTVWKLSAETDDAASLDLSFKEFLSSIAADHVDALLMQPLLNFIELTGSGLEPGQLLSAHPPYCMKSDTPVSLRAIDALERRRFLADLASVVRDIPDGGQLTFVVKT